MATANVSAFLRRLTRGMVAETLADQSDRQLVEQFLDRHDEAVFEAIVRRHGPMVYRVCWRVMQHHQDAEDTFQATFLLLAKKLGTVRKHASLASWLHGVAHRVALKAKAEAATRRRHEQQARVAQEMPPDQVTCGELRAVLDAELVGLPEKWRLPLVLCYLEGRTQDEAATELGWSKRTLRRRLEEARAALGHHLTRRGIVWPAVLSAVLLSDCVASAVVPLGLVNSIVAAASVLAAGKPAAAGLISANVAALTEGVVKAMFVTKIKSVLAVVLVVGLTLGGIGAGVGLFTNRVAVAQQPGAKTDTDGKAVTNVSESKAPLSDGKENPKADDKILLPGEIKRDLNRGVVLRVKLVELDAKALLMSADVEPARGKGNQAAPVGEPCHRWERNRNRWEEGVETQRLEGREYPAAPAGELEAGR